jgi:YVTN family beta-propeller protein
MKCNLLCIFSVIDSTTNQVIKRIPVGSQPVTVSIDSVEKGINSIAFVANLESNSVSVIDSTRNEVYSPVLSVGKEPSDLTVNDIANRLYVANRGSDSVTVIDYYISTDGKFKNTTITNVPVQKYPSSIAINPQTNRVYVTNYYSNTVSVIDGGTNTVMDTIGVGANPSSIAINPQTNKLYVTNYGSNTVSVIDGGSDRLLANIGVGSFPYKAYYNPKTQIISVLNVGSKTISEIKDTHLLAGITFNVNPSNSGQIDCNGNTISDVDYERFYVGSEIICKARPSSDYAFKSWSTNLPLKSSTSSIASINSSDYGNVTANFQIPVEITLPKAYWEQLYVVLISIMVPAIAGWSIPAIAGYVNSVRQRKVLRTVMGQIMEINNRIHEQKQRRRALEDIQVEIVKKLTEGKISETQYDILNNKISESISEIESDS